MAILGYILLGILIASCTSVGVWLWVRSSIRDMFDDLYSAIGNRPSEDY